MNVGSIMTPDPIVGAPSWSLGDVLTCLYENDIRHLPVVHNGELVGMVSERDLARELMPHTASFDDPEGARARFQRAVADLMTGDVLTIDEEAEVADAIELFVEHRVGALPVVRVGDGELVGILSYIDVLRAARDAF